MTRILLCEGTCNQPELEKLETWTKQFREAEHARLEDTSPSELKIWEEPMAPPPPIIAKMMHGLHHTPHTKVDGRQWICTVCGSERTYGD